MTVSGTNSAISLQESQLMQMIQQQAAKALAASNAAQTQAQSAAGGQNVPGDGSDAQTAATGDQTGVSAAQNLDPNLSPENISALLLELQTQQSSLDTTLLLGGSAAGPGGKTLVDYLTAPSTNTIADNDTGVLGGSGAGSGGKTLVDYLTTPSMMTNGVADDDTALDPTATSPAAGDLSLVDYLE